MISKTIKWDIRNDLVLLSLLDQDFGQRGLGQVLSAVVILSISITSNAKTTSEKRNPHDATNKFLSETSKTRKCFLDCRKFIW